ncbi:hypothetical protein NXG27_00885 [Megasphaera paucivorans]|uniref:Uncharacterized protein n=1 Tax=Megasphaera paucivorans TaxID=349095 RepID=A0A1G9QBI5_9FIRM|nr:hypothetical protein [Megasphaera paucivorans]SDM08386.1 hypothetical protein SAMN05660299_00179 [Megasphaera paucivorans]
MSTDITSDLHYYAVQDCAFLLTDSQCSKPLQDFGYADYAMRNADVMGISDTYITNHGKNSYEVMHFAEGYVRKLSIVQKDVIRIAETYWDNIFFIIHIVENIGVNECRSYDFKHFLKDVIAVSDAIRKVFYPVKFDYLSMEDVCSWKYIHFLSEHLNMVDSIWKMLNFLWDDSVRVQDTSLTDLQQMVREIFSISMSDILKKYIQSIKTESTTISDVHQTTYRNMYKETMFFAEAYRRYISAVKKEKFCITETYWDNISFIIRILENVTIRDTVMQNLRHVIVVQMKLLDGLSKRMAPSKKEIFNLSDTMGRVCSIYRTFMEVMQTMDAISRQMELRKNDRIGLNNHKSIALFHRICETVLTAESFNRDMKFSRIVKELVTIGEALSKYQGKTMPEYFLLADAYVRACNAILEAIRISGNELTLEQFKKDINIPYTFEEFTDFNVGDYEYEKALMRLQVISNATHSQPMLYDVALHVDVDDTNDSGIVEITDTTSATKVYYNKHYYNAPEVQVTLRGGSAFAMPSIMSTDKIDEKGRYFEVELLDSTSNRVTGIISWVSKGW